MMNVERLGNLTMKRCFFLAGLWVLSTAFVTAAIAGQPSSGAGGKETLTWTLGTTVAISPEYEGSDEYRAVVIPYIFPRFSNSGFVDVRGSDDIRFKILNNENFELGPLAGYRFDREEEDGDKLVGLGDVDGGLVLGGFARVALWPSTLYAGVSYHRTVTGDVDGGQLKFGLEYEAKPTDNVVMFARTGATYADDEYMDSYFGVSASQAATSAAGLQQFDADAGIKDVYASLGTRINFSESWAFNMTGRYARLVGDAADSPVIETEDQFSASAGLTYSFNFK